MIFLFCQTKGTKENMRDNATTQSWVGQQSASSTAFGLEHSINPGSTYIPWALIQAQEKFWPGLILGLASGTWTLTLYRSQFLHIDGLKGISFYVTCKMSRTGKSMHGLSKFCSAMLGKNVLRIWVAKPLFWHWWAARPITTHFFQCNVIGLMLNFAKVGGSSCRCWPLASAASGAKEKVGGTECEVGGATAPTQEF